LSIVAETAPGTVAGTAPETVAESYRFVVGVDTHAATHTYAIVECPTGMLVDQQAFPTSPAGLARAMDWIARRTEGDLDATLVAVEGTRTYGALLAGRLAVAGYRVVEAPTPRRNRATGKNDDLDALAAARSSLPMRLTQLRDQRSDTPERIALQVLLTAREEATGERTRAINALTALLRTHDLGIDARKSLTRAQITTISTWRRRTEAIGTATARAQAIRLARRITTLNADLKDNRKQLRDLVTAQAPVLLEQPGVGPVTAAVVLTAWSHPGRVRTEAAFAAIAGVSPIPASSGNTTRHRLNRGGDRRLNRALHTIVVTRTRSNDETQAYIERRLAAGKTRREIRRSLKRYTARRLYRSLNALDNT
jgi:transposase